MLNENVQKKIFCCNVCFQHPAFQRTTKTLCFGTPWLLTFQKLSKMEGRRRGAETCGQRGFWQEVARLACFASRSKGPGVFWKNHWDLRRFLKKVFGLKCWKWWKQILHPHFVGRVVTILVLFNMYLWEEFLTKLLQPSPDLRPLPAVARQHAYVSEQRGIKLHTKLNWFSVGWFEACFVGIVVGKK